MADGLMNHDAWQTLRQKRIAVVDSAVPLEVVAKVRLWNGIWCFFFFVNGRGWSSGCRVQQETMTQFIMACAGADGTPSSSLGWSDADA